MPTETSVKQSADKPQYVASTTKKNATLTLEKLRDHIAEASKLEYPILGINGQHLDTTLINHDDNVGKALVGATLCEAIAAMIIKGVMHAAQTEDALPTAGTIYSTYINMLEEKMLVMRMNKEKPDKPNDLKAQSMNANIISMFMINLQYVGKIISIDSKASNSGPLAFYQPDGDDKGLYVSDRDQIMSMIQSYAPCATSEANAAYTRVSNVAPKIRLCTDENLIPVNNGVYMYKEKKLIDFNPGLVFMSKANIDYNPYAQNVHIHNDTDNTDWDVESWIAEFFSDKRMVELIWQVIGAAVRYNVPWHRGVLFYSESGNNGKGTICQLIRNIIGSSRSASIQMSDISKQYSLEALPRIQAIITDENDVGDFIDRAGALKALITGDEIVISAKYEANMPYAWHGLMIQCINEMPKVRDRSESYYRRFIMVPFSHSFTGNERSYIKNDYITRQDVLEYVLWRVLNMAEYYELDEPAETKRALSEYKEYNDPVRAFVAEIIPQLRWEYVPNQFLYDLYLKWFEHNVPRGAALNARRFATELKMQLEYNNLYAPTKDSVHMAKAMSAAPELLIKEYGLNQWMKKGVVSNDPAVLCRPDENQLKPTYRGIRYVGGQRNWDPTIKAWIYADPADDPVNNIGTGSIESPDDIRRRDQALKMIEKNVDILKNHMPECPQDYIPGLKPFTGKIRQEVEVWNPLALMTRTNPNITLQMMYDAVYDNKVPAIDIDPTQVLSLAPDVWIECQNNERVYGKDIDIEAIEAGVWIVTPQDREKAEKNGTLAAVKQAENNTDTVDSTDIVDAVTEPVDDEPEPTNSTDSTDSTDSTVDTVIIVEDAPQDIPDDIAASIPDEPSAPAKPVASAKRIPGANSINKSDMTYDGFVYDEAKHIYSPTNQPSYKLNLTEDNFDDTLIQQAWDELALINKKDPRLAATMPESLVRGIYVYFIETMTSAKREQIIKRGAFELDGVPDCEYPILNEFARIIDEYVAWDKARRAKNEENNKH